MLIGGVILLGVGLFYFFVGSQIFGIFLFAVGMLLFFVGINKKMNPNKEPLIGKKLGIRACYNINPEEFRKLSPELTVFAIETTGVDLRHNDMFEISMCPAEDFQIKEHFTTFLKSKVAIPNSIVVTTGITNEMIAGAPTFNEMVNDILPYIREKTLLCYDLSHCVYFLSRAIGNTDERLMSAQAYDVKKMAEALIPASKIDNYFLSTVMEYLDLEMLPECAENRCFNLLEVYNKLLPLAEEKWPIKE